jgi:hypothetical protein
MRSWSFLDGGLCGFNGEMETLQGAYDFLDGANNSAHLENKFGVGFCFLDGVKGAGGA